METFSLIGSITTGQPHSSLFDHPQFRPPRSFPCPKRASRTIRDTGFHTIPLNQKLPAGSYSIVLAGDMPLSFILAGATYTDGSWDWTSDQTITDFTVAPAVVPTVPTGVTFNEATPLELIGSQIRGLAWITRPGGQVNDTRCTRSHLVPATSGVWAWSWTLSGSVAVYSVL